MPFPFSISGAVIVPLNGATPPRIADAVAKLKDELTSVQAAILSTKDDTVTFSGAAAYFPFTFIGIDKGVLTISQNSAQLDIKYTLRTTQYAVLIAIVSAVFSWFASGAHNGDYSGHAFSFIGLFLFIWSVSCGGNYTYNLISFPIWLRSRLRGFAAGEH